VKAQLKKAQLIRKSFYTLLILSILSVLGIFAIGKSGQLSNRNPGSTENEQEDMNENTPQVLNINIDNQGPIEEDSQQQNSQTEIAGLAKEIEEITKSTPVITASNIPTSKPKPTPPPPPPNPSGCPVSTLSCVPCNMANGGACRAEAGATTGYLGWACQNNNPGNIRYSSARIDYIVAHSGPGPCGERFDSRGGTYMIFSTYSAGRSALKAYMKAINAGTHTAYSQCATSAGCSLSYVFSKYAPGDPNYAKNIADKIGVEATTKLDWVIKNKFEELINAIQSKEGFFTQ